MSLDSGIPENEPHAFGEYNATLSLLPDNSGCALLIATPEPDHNPSSDTSREKFRARKVLANGLAQYFRSALHRVFENAATFKANAVNPRAYSRITFTHEPLFGSPDNLAEQVFESLEQMCEQFSEIMSYCDNDPQAAIEKFRDELQLPVIDNTEPGSEAQINAINKRKGWGNKREGVEAQIIQAIFAATQYSPEHSESVTALAEQITDWVGKPSGRTLEGVIGLWVKKQRLPLAQTGYIAGKVGLVLRKKENLPDGMGPFTP